MENLRIRRKSLSDQVVEKIQDNIIKKVYKPGDKLPVENEMAKTFGVSRTTIREALKKLSMTGVVEIRQGDGTFVKQVSPRSFMEALLPMLILDVNNLIDIFEARLAIEMKIVELATKMIEEEEIFYLKELVCRMEDNINKKKFKEYNQNDFIFHMAIAKYSKNIVLGKIQEVLQDLLKGSIDSVSDAPFAIQRSIKVHKAIVDAMEKRDVEMAVEAMRQHIQGAIDYLKSR